MPVDGAQAKIREEAGVHIDSRHWLKRVRRTASPHHDERPHGQAPSLIVLHGISLPPGRFGTGLIDRFFAGRLPADVADTLELTGVRVSSHLLIDRKGTPTQYVPFDRRAWHAGVSSWAGRPNCNDYAIGIELEGTDSRAYTRAQYGALVRLTRLLLETYPRLSPEAIVGHNEVAPGRKTDPGPSFDWHRYLTALY